MERFRLLALTAFFSLPAAPLMAQDGHAERSGGLPQFDPHWWPSQIFWLAVCFVVLYTVVARRILPEIGGVVEGRRARIEADIATAERLKSEAEEARKAYEAGLDNARSEAARIIADVHAQLKAVADQQAAAFRDTMERQMDDLSRRLEGAKAAAMEDMNTIAAEIASEAAEKIAGIPADPKKAQTVVRALNRREAA